MKNCEICEMNKWCWVKDLEDSECPTVREIFNKMYLIKKLK